MKPLRTCRVLREMDAGLAMPDEPVPQKTDQHGFQVLSEEQLKTLNAWMATHTKLGFTACPVCGHIDWTVAPHILEIRPFAGGNMIVGGPIYPMVMFQCKTCGYGLMMNAMAMGVLQPPEKKDGG